MYNAQLGEVLGEKQKKKRIDSREGSDDSERIKKQKDQQTNVQHSSRMAAVDDSIGDNILGCCFPATDRLSFYITDHFLDPEKITIHLSLSIFFCFLNTNHLSWASAGGKNRRP
jgi:hypothetical protein